MDKRWRRVRWACAALAIAGGLVLVGVDRWTTHVTASGRPRALWRATLPGIDVGLDVSPAAIGQDGAIELWPIRTMPMIMCRCCGCLVRRRCHNACSWGRCRAEPYPSYPPARSNRYMPAHTPPPLARPVASEQIPRFVSHRIA